MCIDGRIDGRNYQYSDERRTWIMIRAPSGDHQTSTFSPWSIIEVGVRDKKAKTAEGFPRCKYSGTIGISELMSTHPHSPDSDAVPCKSAEEGLARTRSQRNNRFRRNVRQCRDCREDSRGGGGEIHWCDSTL